jgi:hypothetical protein
MRLISNAIRKAVKLRTYRPFKKDQIVAEQNKQTGKWEIIHYEKGRKTTLAKDIDSITQCEEIVNKVTRQ